MSVKGKTKSKYWNNKIKISKINKKPYKINEVLIGSIIHKNIILTKRE
jgi:hypothetical protein